MSAMKSYDVFGNIAVLKFRREIKVKDRRRFAEDFLKKNKSISTVLEKTEGFKGRLRKQSTRFLAGEKTKEALYKENGCEFRLNVDTCYFSPRLSTDRKDVASMVKKGENVLVMFGGVAPYAIVIAKNSKAGRVVSVELSRECSKYALINVKRNKLKNVRIVQGDVRRVIGRGKKIDEKFDRIMMARPNLKDDFLDVAFSVSKKNTMIHYHGFYEEDKLQDLKDLIIKRAKDCRKRIRMIGIKKAGNIGARKYRYRADFKVLN